MNCTETILARHRLAAMTRMWLAAYIARSQRLNARCNGACRPESARTNAHRNPATVGRFTKRQGQRPIQRHGECRGRSRPRRDATFEWRQRRGYEELLAVAHGRGEKQHACQHHRVTEYFWATCFRGFGRKNFATITTSPCDRATSRQPRTGLTLLIAWRADVALARHRRDSVLQVGR